MLPTFADGTTEQPQPKPVEDPCLSSGSIIGCENRSLGEAVDLAGTPYRLHYQSDRTAGTKGASSVAMAYAADLGGWTLNVHHRYDPASNTLFLGNGALRSSESLGTVTASSNSGYLIASEDGRRVYEFNAAGQHTQTRHALTGATLLNFGYDAAGRLLNVTDGNGNVTSFTHNTQGKLTAIVAPYGQTTTVTLSNEGYIAALKDPAGKTIKAKYIAHGLLTAFTNASGATSSMTYDANGLLQQDKSAAGGKQTLKSNSAGDTVTLTTAMGRATHHQTIVQTDGSIDRTVTEPTGLASTMHKTAQLAAAVTRSDGIQLAMTPVSDSRFGNSASIPQTYTIATPGGLVNTMAASRTSPLAGTDPLILSSQTETLSLNGNTYTSSYDAASKTSTHTSPAGRQTASVVNDLGQVTNEQVAGLSSVNYSYDTHGRLTEINSGSDPRTTHFAYDAQGYLQSITDPLNQTLSYVRDKVGRITQQTLPDGNLVKFAYDGDGNLLKFTNPAGKAYGFSYSKTGQLSSITLPAAKGAKNKQAFSYNLDGQLTGMTRLDGSKLAYTYDNAGRLSKFAPVANATTAWTYGYDATRGYLSSITEPGGVNLGVTRDGSLLTALTWSGTVAGQVGLGYNNDFQVQTISVNNADPIGYGYDNDGLLVTAGALTLQRSSQNNLRTSSLLGSVQDATSYNTFGEVSHYTASSAIAGALLSVDYIYDKLGRISQCTESLAGGTPITYAYIYDLAGRLASVSDGTTTTTYSYDKNGNRTGASSAGGASPANTTGTYDAQDRLLTYGAIKYGYNGNGEVTSRTQGSGNSAATTSFEYNLLGNLVAATLSDGSRIDYLVDGTGLRVGRKKGTQQQTFLYQDSLKPVAELDGSGTIVSRFVYVTHVNVPDYMVKGGVTYRIVTDHLGSPRLVVNAATGEIAQQMDYDEFGNVLQDTSPGFQPFGFAGGLYDQDTRLIHYGAREFDPKTGRWLSRDPILFSGGSYNAYANLNDPVNMVDPSGREGLGSQIMTRISDYLHSKFSSVKAGPVTISTDAPKISIGASQEVKAGDVSLIEVSAEASVEVLTTGGAADDLMKGNVTIGAKQPFLAKIPIIGKFFCNKIEAEATVKINPELVDRMNTNLNRAWQAQQEN